MEELKEDFYQARNLTGKDGQLLASISTESMNSVNKTIGAISDLLKNLNIYKECLVDSINLEAENADIATKYGGKQDQASGQQPYLLPGVVTTPRQYDIEAIKTDSKRIGEIQNERQKSESQKEVYLRICKEDVKVFIESWKRTNYYNVAFNEFIDSLNQSINKNY